jgi:hypothetical protein
VTLPDPLAADGVINIDPDSRTVIVKPAPDASGYAKSLWWEGHQALTEAERTGRRGEAVWAHIPGHPQVAYATPGKETTLRFRLDPDDYRKLVSTPGLRAVVVVDKRSSRILNVAFRGGRKGS